MRIRGDSFRLHCWGPHPGGNLEPTDSCSRYKPSEQGSVLRPTFMLEGEGDVRRRGGAEGEEGPE